MCAIALEDRVASVQIISPLTVSRQHHCIVPGSVSGTKDHRVLLTVEFNGVIAGRQSVASDNKRERHRDRHSLYGLS